MGYLTNFIVYTLAMVGVMVLALMVFKNATLGGHKGNAKFLKVLDTMSLGPRKTLYIVSAGEEKFLIAGDVDKTTLISKLKQGAGYEEKISAIATTSDEDFSTKSFKDTMNSIPARSSYMDKGVVGIHSTQRAPYSSVMKNLAERMREEGIGRKTVLSGDIGRSE